MSERWRERLLAALAALIALTVVAIARGIEDSLLSDAVGAGGVPQGVGIAMFLAALALFVKSFLGRPAAAVAPAAAPTPQAATTPAHGPGAKALRAGGLVLILLGYALLLPWAGYMVSISLLVGAAGWLAGAPPRWTLLLCALLAGPALWLLFHQILQVRMPVGTLWN